MLLAQVAPSVIPERRRLRRRVHDVREHHGLHRDVPLGHLDPAGEEPLDLAHRGFPVAGPDVLITSRQLDERRPLDVLGQVPARLDHPAPRAQTGPMDDEGWRGDPGECVADVGSDQGLDMRDRRARALREPLHRSEPRDRLLVVGVRRQLLANELPGPLVPRSRPPDRFDRRACLLLRLFPREVIPPRVDGGAVEEHQGGNPPRMQGRREDAVEPALVGSEDGHRSEVEGVEHRDHVLDEFLEGRSSARRVSVGRTPAAWVEQDQAGKRAEPPEVSSVMVPPPVPIQVGTPRREVEQIHRSIADGLVADPEAATPRVLDR